MRKGGLEPPYLSVPDPKSGASANSATFAFQNMKDRVWPRAFATTPPVPILELHAPLRAVFHSSLRPALTGVIADVAISHCASRRSGAQLLIGRRAFICSGVQSRRQPPVTCCVLQAVRAAAPRHRPSAAVLHAAAAKDIIPRPCAEYQGHIWIRIVLQTGIEDRHRERTTALIA